MIEFLKMNDTDYFSHEYISCSELKSFAKGVNYYIADKANPKQSDAMDFGKAFHQAILENDFDFSKIWKTKATIDKHTESITKMKNALGLYYNFSSNSNEYVLLDHENGLRCKIDSYDYLRNTIYDIKTCQSAKFEDVIKDIFNYKYHWQSKFYIDLINRYSGTQQTMFKFIFIEKQEPYSIIEVELDGEILDLAYSQYEHLLNELKLVKNAKLDSYEPSFNETLLTMDMVPTWLIAKQ
jgi:hypothetical protein